MPPIAPVRGTHDLLPDASAAWQWLLDTHRRVAGEHGYRLADTPVFEHTELFERGVGVGTDVVDKEMYTFADRAGRSLTLRPEGTAGMVRAVLGAHLTQHERPVRVHYVGPMFRHDRPQKGRYRQFAQVGVECIGERSPYLDAEVIEVGWRFLRALGIDDVTLQVNSLGDPADRARYRAALRAYYEPLRDQLCADCRRRLDVNPLRLLDCKRDAAHAERAPRLEDSLSATSAQFFDTVLDGLRDAAIPWTRNWRLVRGLDYYVDTAFEYWHSSLEGAQNALGGGGRYDGLAEVLGFAATPGIGYAFGIERLLLIAEQGGSLPPSPPAAEVVVCSLEPGQATAAAALARGLRDAAVRTVLDTSERKLGAKLGAADRLGARFCVLVGSDEAMAHEATLRDLRERTQERVSAAELGDRVRRALHPTPDAP